MTNITSTFSTTSGTLAYCVAVTTPMSCPRALPDGTYPEFTAPFGQLDASISYEITPQIAITLEGINLTETAVRTYARDKKELWYAQELDRRFLLGARFKF